MKQRVGAQPGVTNAQLLWEETGDPRWLDKDYARRMVGPVLSARHRAARKERTLWEGREGEMFAHLRRMLPNARKNAARRARECSLTEDDLWELAKRANGHCEVSGVRFSLKKHKAGRMPFAPSLDRIDGAKGYVPSNVRLVCQMANLAMNVWDAETLREFIKQASDRRRNPDLGPSRSARRQRPKLAA